MLKLSNRCIGSHCILFWCIKVSIRKSFFFIRVKKVCHTQGFSRNSSVYIWIVMPSWCFPCLVSLEMTFWLWNPDATHRKHFKNLYIEQRLMEVLALSSLILVLKYDSIFRGPVLITWCGIAVWPLPSGPYTPVLPFLHIIFLGLL